MSTLAALFVLLLAGSSPSYGDPFWSHWGDGRAELASYDLVFSRYGEDRAGSAVAIFVTETFSDELRVKADPGKHDPSDEFPVLKLNLVEDFPTGIYDYNLMTSAFVAITPRGERPAGHTTKVSFGSQEWCGNAYQQMLFHDDRIAIDSHSYFDGEADRRYELPADPGTIAEDALLIWARGHAYPAVAPGESVRVPMLRSAKHARLRHRDPGIVEVTLGRAAETHRVGDREARAATVSDLDGTELWSFEVEVAEPRRILSWTNADGQRATLIASERVAYWQHNDSAGTELLGPLGLKPRPARTP